MEGIEQLYGQRKPQLFKKKFGSYPGTKQDDLQHELQILADVDISLFQYRSKSSVELKPEFPIQLKMRNRIDRYTHWQLGDN